ncbi:hypothetical protein PPACK8108_LOCUS25769, partial [Phakopsora pachyrhizi]
MASTSLASTQSQQQAKQQQQKQQQKQQDQYYYSDNQRYTSVGAQLLSRASSNNQDEPDIDADGDGEDDEDDDEDDDEEEEDEDEGDDLYNDDLQRLRQREQQQNQGGEMMEMDDDLDRNSDSSFSDSVSMSSSPSIPSSDDIDFNLVYALHTFLATVEGQASVVKGDQLTLLDDSNSYWWLIRVLKTQVVGYIPAENIETPYERLARLNKHRNVDLSSATPSDHITGPASSLAQTRFAQRIPSAGDPVRSRSPQDRRKGPAPPPMPGPGTFSPPPVAPAPGTGKGKTVAFSAPTYFENSGNEWSDEDDDDDDESGDWDGEGEFKEGEEGFEDEEEEEEEEEDEDDEEDEYGSQDGDLHHNDSQNQDQAHPSNELSKSEQNSSSNQSNPDQSLDPQRQLQDQLAQEQKQQQQRQQQVQQQQQQQQVSNSNKTSTETEEAPKSAGGWAKLRLAAKASADSLLSGVSGSSGSKDDSRSQLGKGLSPLQRAQQINDQSSTARDFTQQQQLSQQSSTSALSISSPIFNQSQSNRKVNGSTEKLNAEETKAKSALKVHTADGSETKKLTLTPDIARDTSESDIQNNSSRPLNSPSNFVSSTSSQTSSLRRNETQGGPDDEPLNSNDGHSQSILSNDSSHGQDESKGGNGKRGVGSKKDKKDEEPELKKKKSGGLLSGFFGRRKDKKASSTGGKETSEDGRSSLEGDRNPPSPSSPSDFSHSSSVQSPLIPNESSQPQQPAKKVITSSGTVTNGGSGSGSDDMFSTDATLRKQQTEAQEMMYRQFGITRKPEDTTNTTVFSQRLHNPQQRQSSLEIEGGGVSLAPGQSPLSPTGSVSLNGFVQSPINSTAGVASRIRPGSLIGSPGIHGMEVPMLNVLRIFAGRNVECEATFRTVLLSQQTTTTELLLQSIQRFHLPSEVSEKGMYYLTIKDVVSGDENRMGDDQRPLKVFEEMNEALGMNGLMLPSVKRSSIGSISSISSNLSQNPAISRLGMNDFSDDSAVKFYINRFDHTELGNGQISDSLSTQKLEGGGDSLMVEDNFRENGLSASQNSIIDLKANSSNKFNKDQPTSGIINPTQSDLRKHQIQQAENELKSPSSNSSSAKFSVRIRIYPNDLPDGLIFDPQSQAIIPKSALQDRPNRNSFTNSSSNSNFREKVMMFSKNVNVLEVIEYGLEAFGIDEGVVDGGDDVEEKVSRRRSNSKIRYGLSMKTNSNQNETPVNLTSKVLDSYSVLPIFKAVDRLSKDMRRISMEASIIIGNVQDVQSTDPIFILRKANSSNRRDSNRNSGGGIAGAIADELALMNHHKKNNKSNHIQHPPRSSSIIGAPHKQLQQVSHAAEFSNPARKNGKLDSSVGSTYKELRRSSFLSATRNSEKGVDINLRDRATIRSRKNQADESFRYSYIDPEGAELDISELMESEWSPKNVSSSGRKSTEYGRRSHKKGAMGSSQNSISSLTEEGYASALESPPRRAMRDDDDDEAIEALKTAPLMIDGNEGPSENQEKRNQQVDNLKKVLKPRDLLIGALDKQHRGNQPGENGNGLNDGSSISPQEALERRIERVLAKVKKGSSPVPASSSRSTEESIKTSNSSNSKRNGNGSNSTKALNSQPEGMESKNSSRSNSTSGSNSPTTPITATSPSSYTPISSATRGIGIESRQSTQR